MPFVRTSDDVALHYSDWGSGQPVLLIHGWPLTAEMWEYQASALVEAGYRVISYDRRGFGRSDRPWSRYDYDRLADDLDSLIRHLDLRDIVLVGFSMGGGEVARFLSRHGAARVAGAALIAAVTPCLARHPDNPHGLDHAVFDRVGFLAGYAETVFRPGMDPVVAAGLKAWYLSMALPASGPATLATVRAWYETDFRPDMSAFTVPTLILHGAQDQSVPAAIAGRAAASLIQGARYVEYAEAGHFLPVDEKTRVTADLLAFLNGLRRSEPSAP